MVGRCCRGWFHCESLTRSELRQIAAAQRSSLTPPLIVSASFAMTESLSTFLLTWEVFLLLRTRGERPVAWAAAAGIVAGASQLVRADAVVMLPPVFLFFLLIELPCAIRV